MSHAPLSSGPLDPIKPVGDASRWLGRWVRRVRVWRCDHAFQLADLRMNPEMKPDESDRVSWPCAKCGHVFWAHCGLDISPKHGPILPRPTNRDVERRGQ